MAALEKLKPTPDELIALKEYMVVLHDDDDAEISRLFSAAVEYLEGAGISRKFEGDEGYSSFLLAAFSLALGYKDEKGTEQDTMHHENIGLRRLINQMKFSPRDEK